MLDLIRPTSGRAFVFGIQTNVDPVGIRRRIGYLPLTARRVLPISA